MDFVSANQPVAGQTYTARQVFDLDLKTHPWFRISQTRFPDHVAAILYKSFNSIAGMNFTILTSVFSIEDCVNAPSFADSKWNFITFMCDGTPLFVLSQDNEVPIMDFVDVWKQEASTSHPEYFDVNETILFLKGFVPPFPGLAKLDV